MLSSVVFAFSYLTITNVLLHMRPEPDRCQMTRLSHLYLDARTVQTPGGSSTTIDLRGYQQQLSERDQEILRLKDEIAEYRR